MKQSEAIKRLERDGLFSLRLFCGCLITAAISSYGLKFGEEGDWVSEFLYIAKVAMLILCIPTLLCTFVLLGFAFYHDRNLQDRDNAVPQHPSSRGVH